MKKLLLSCALITATTLSAQYNDYPTRRGAVANEMCYTPEKTLFSVWSPAADSVHLAVYDAGVGGQRLLTQSLEPQTDGTWTGTINGDHKGQFYTFNIYQNGRWYGETPGIFAKAVGLNGQRACILKAEDIKPAGWDADKRPALASTADAIVYEMHHRDFSQDPSSGISNRGKFLALTEHGTKNADGLSTGIDHLVDLGVTHVQILPSYDFGSIDEAQAGGEARVLESGAAVGGSYNWGYDPMNYNVPEGSYSTNPADPASRIMEFKQMVQALHKAGIRVVLDVVYNHTYDVERSNFERTCPGYFYRFNANGKLGNASGCGNETASEREMMRRFMIESVKYWATEFHIDGFRFDLMAIHDKETMRDIRAMLDQIDPSIIIHGEGWAAGECQLPGDQMAVKASTYQLPGIGAFCDDMRDALRGPFSDDHQGAFLAGLPGNEESIKFGLVGCIKHPAIDMQKVNYSKKAWTAEPQQCIAYVSCHDDMCLVDRLKASIRLGKGELERLDKMAQTFVLLSQGTPFIWCGEEVLRDKKGVHNSFCSPDSINDIVWTNKTRNIDLYNYYKNLIAVRKAHKAFRMGDAKLVRKNVDFLPVATNNVVAWHLNGAAVGDSWNDIYVVANSNKSAAKVTLPKGNYKVVIQNGQVDPKAKKTFAVKGSVSVPAQSVLMLVK